MLNPWGVANLDAQRSDLWLLNMSSAVSYFLELSEATYEAIGLQKARMPSASEASFYASKVTLPVQKLNLRKVLQGTVPRNMPGYFDAVDSMQVDFVHDTEDDQSAIFTLLKIWSAVARTGRVRKQSDKVLLLRSPSDKPQFKFDLRVELLGGSNGSDEDSGLAEGAKYTIAACWPRSVQHSALDYQKSGVHSITCQFNVQEVTS